MNVSALLRALYDDFAQKLDAARSFTAQVTALSSGKTKIKRWGAATADGEPYSRLAGFDVAVGDEVIVMMVGNKPVVLGKNQRSEPTAHTLSAPLTVNADGALALAVRTAAGSSRFRVDTLAGEVELWNSTDLVVYSGTGTGEVARIDGATGDVTLGGDVRLYRGVANELWTDDALIVRVSDDFAFVVTDAAPSHVFRVHTLTGGRLVETLADTNIGSLTSHTHAVTGKRKSAGASPTIAKFAALGATATFSVAGTDSVGVVTLTPNGTGIAAGAQVQLTFNSARADANYVVHLHAGNDAGAARMADWYPTALATGTWDLASRNTLTAGTTYQIAYEIVGYEP